MFYNLKNYMRIMRGKDFNIFVLFFSGIEWSWSYVKVRFHMKVSFTRVGIVLLVRVL